MAHIIRCTFFKIDPADHDFALDLAKTMYMNNLKDGKPYMISCTGYKLHDDERSKGYSLMYRTRFESLEHMKYYDTECPAHTELKAKLKPKLKEPPMVVYMDA